MKTLYLYIILLYTVNTAIAQERAGQDFSRRATKKNTTVGMNVHVDSLFPLICYVELPYAHQNKIYQDLFIKNNAGKITSIKIACFDITDKQDSIQVYSVKLRGGKSGRRKSRHSNINLGKADSLAFHPLYKKILLNNKKLPAGDYRMHLTLRFKDTVVRKTYSHNVDSMLSIGSAANNIFDNIYSEQGTKSFLGLSFHRKKAPPANNTRNILRRSSRKVEEAFKAKGFTVSNRNQGDKTFADVYSQGRYIGYYKIDMNEPIAESIEKRKAKLNGNITGGANPSVQNNKPVFSQIKELNREKEAREVTGNISITGNMASGQEEYSQQENNFYEVLGQMEIPVMGVPVMLEGYYTSQDKGRIAKAGYFRLHYDSERAKSELINLISGYNGKYNSASSDEKVLRNIYGTSLKLMAEEKDKLWAGMIKETGIVNPEKFKTDTSGLFEEITLACSQKLKDTISLPGADQSESKAREAQQTAKERYGQAVDKYRRMRELEDKIRHYNTLLEEYRKNNYYDSLMAYEQLGEMDYTSMGEKSYKQLSKAAGGLLPPGESKKFITGLKSLDMGIFSKQVSSYTLNGQTMKGVDVAYDLGFCETGLTYGRIEYVSRDGFLDKYSGYSGRVSFKPVRGQKTSLIYYGYTPSNRMLNEDGFFKDVDVHMPSFKSSPIHILSATHSGKITENVKLAAEAAASYRTFEEFRKTDVKMTDKMSYRLDVEGRIPETAIDLQAGYEHVGKQFENNTLPLNLSGTERYTAGATGQFLKNILTLGVQYNYLVQQNFASKSVHSKWGFDIKTTSKRYPSASLSYKPFTTFRSFADTFNLPQRPILGAVWLGKLSYQLKKKAYVLRLTAIYNRNTALVDTVESNSNIAQLNAIYTRGKINLMVNAGQTRMKAGDFSPVHGTTNFLTAAVGYTLNAQWNVSVGQDIGMRKTGLSRYGASLGCGYRFRNTPLAIRAGFRYNTYQVSEAQSWKNVYAGLLDINWQFRFKMNDRI